MKRMNLGDDRLTEAAQVTQLRAYLSEYPAPEGNEVTLEDAVKAVREVREALTRVSETLLT
jgi:hypothetical protein